MLYTVLSVVAFLGWQVSADLYMQNCRGSNNRLDEQNRDRNNGQRLFDSQNNDRGGYNVGKLTYYVGEEVPISWTNQHSAGHYQLRNNEFVLQYSCGALMRDGETTGTIPINPTQCLLYDCDRDVEYGRHESWKDYMYCRASSRNYGLFTSNRKLNGRAAIYTRQNNAGTRRGYECPEERDYYPYWRPSMWRDVAIYTNQPGRCAAYQAESQNVKARESCMYSERYWNEVLYGYVSNSRRGQLPLNRTDCENLEDDDNTNGTYPMAEWVTTPAFGIDAPNCQETITTRANHHGTPGQKQYWTYTWTVPDIFAAGFTTDDANCCVLRMRYNITTSDYEAWLSDDLLTPGVDYRNNTQENNPNPNDDPAWIYTWTKYGIPYEDVAEEFDGDRDNELQYESAGYVFVNNPRVDPFLTQWTHPNAANGYTRIQLQLAINTNQFGRTFQDRTHCFEVTTLPDAISENVGAKSLKLLTVQGKRGNIVQVYPATEYFFIPEPLNVAVGDWVHFCWTGSNTNPNNNDGQGKQGTDRTNLVILTDEQYSKGDGYSNIEDSLSDHTGANPVVGDLGNNYPDYIKIPVYGIPDYVNYANKRGLTASNLGGFDIEVITQLAVTRDIGISGLLDYGNMEELDDAGTTFCIEPVQVTTTGEWNFLCTRNNNFSNRSQKGTLTAIDGVTNTNAVTQTGGTFTSNPGEAILVVNSDMVQQGDTLVVETTTWFNRFEDSTVVEVRGAGGGDLNTESLGSSGWLELWIPYTPRSLNSPTAQYRSTASAEWAEHAFGATIEYTQGTFYGVTNINSGGYYKIENTPNVGEIIAILVGLGAFAVAIGFILFRKCRK